VSDGTAIIGVKGAWAQLHHAPLDTLSDTLTVLDPGRWYNRAFKERRWDGKVRLYKGNSFPAGFVPLVKKALDAAGYSVQVSGLGVGGIDVSRFGRDYLPGIELWDNEYEGALALLKNRNGYIKSPTGSGKTEIIAAAARYLWEEKGWRTLVVVPKKGLAKQTAERLRHYYGDDLTVGQCGDGVKTTGDVTVATAQTLIGFRPRKRKGRIICANPLLTVLVKTREVLVLDESHHTSANTWYEIAMASNAVRRFGLSGTPIKKQALADMKFLGATGPLLYEAQTSVMIEQKLLTKPKIAVVYSDASSEKPFPTHIVPYRDRVTGELKQRRAGIPYKDAYEQGIVYSKRHNRAVVRAVEWLVDRKRNTLVLCRRKAHWLLLSEMFKAAGIDFIALWGNTNTDRRDEAKALLGDRKISVILATTIFDEGEDIRCIDAIVLAEGVKTVVNSIQRLGRGMRTEKGGENDLWVVDFCPTCHIRLREHAIARCEAWEGEGYEVVVVDAWPEPDELLLDEKALLPFLNWDAAVKLSEGGDE